MVRTCTTPKGRTTCRRISARRLTQTHLSIPLQNGALLLGAWQGVYLFEHRRAPHTREVVAHFIGD
ncbi:MAG TPA: YjbQ family protein [Vitreimonas sp.]|nr:YjbQ family protein [Vitreimonas sp.]HYD86976.1 YjbQ family protein [Vitreimonas sp.]